VIEDWPIGHSITRVHRTGVDSRQFNPGHGGPTRFGFFHDPAGRVVPTWYGGEDLSVATAETLFHDLPLMAGAVLAQSRYHGASYSTVAPRRPLRLVKLYDNGLRALGLRNSQLCDTEPIDYPEHRALGASGSTHNRTDRTGWSG
jgi:hypothetical protein